MRSQVQLMDSSYLPTKDTFNAFSLVAGAGQSLDHKKQVGRPQGEFNSWDETWLWSAGSPLGEILRA